MCVKQEQIKSVLGGSPGLCSGWGSSGPSLLPERRMQWLCKEQISSQIPSWYNVTDCWKVQKTC